jgi:large subunit ribosomal protein L24
MSKSKARIKRDDTVIVIAGKHKGKTGRVLKVLPEDRRVVVEKVNLVKRQMKAQGDRPGGTLEKEASLHISNVALYDSTAKKRIKVGYGQNDEGRKVRVDRKTRAEI